jgi:hypothetical protein
MISASDELCPQNQWEWTTNHFINQKVSGSARGNLSAGHKIHMKSFFLAAKSISHAALSALEKVDEQTTPAQ